MKDISFRRNINFDNERKEKKDYELADKIRNELLDLGVEIKDTSSGTDWNLKS